MTEAAPLITLPIAVSLFRSIAKLIFTADTVAKASKEPEPAPTPPPQRTASPSEQLCERGLLALRSVNALAYAREGAVRDAESLLDEGESGLARTLLIGALAVHSNVEAQALLARVLLMRGENDEAAQLLRRLARHPEHAAGAEVQLATLHEDRGDLDGARKHYERAMALDPGRGVASERARKLKMLAERKDGPSPQAFQAMSRLWGQTAAGDRYRVVEEAGRGGAATLFRAEDARTGRTVALKVFHPRGEPAVRAERIRREAAIAARFDHPAIVPVLDVMPLRDLMVMPFYDEGSLKSVVSEGPLPPLRAFAFLAELAEVLAHVHAAGVAHLDIKPSNILLRQGRPVLTDFGASGAHALGQTAGTPPYMAPETLRLAEADVRSDLFALGVVLIECLTGVPSTDPRAIEGEARWRKGAVHLATRLLVVEPGERLADAAVVVTMCRAIAATVESG